MAEVDQQKLEQFMGKMVTDMSAAMSGPLVIMGVKLGLYKALAQAGAMSSEQLAERSGVRERYVREWLAAQAASGFVDYAPGERQFSMSPEQQMALADEDSPVYLASAFELIASAYIDEPRITEAFKQGKGFGWHEHHECLFRGTERFFRTSYRANLISDWLPSLDGVVDKLASGAKVADVGCGHGASTILMAEAFPNSQFTGYDYHDASIKRAREARERWRERQHCVRVGGRQGRARRGFRSRRLLRLSSRHGRSGRGSEAHPGGHEARRDFHDR